MKTKAILTIFFVAIATLSLNAQKNAIIKFDTLIHDFGKIKEDGGKVAASFLFTNKGTDTLRILNINPSCSCITAEGSKKPILPGQNGFISVKYDPNSRPGNFSKGVTIVSNATISSVILVLKGDVIPRAKPVVDSFPVKSGSLKMKSNQVALMDTKNTVVKTDTLLIYNVGNKAMTFTFSNVPAHMTCRAVPSPLPPNKRGMFIITYDAAKKNDFGLVYDYINILTNDSSEASKQLTISTNIVEDFSKLTPDQKKDAPKISFVNDTYDFGTVKEGDTVKYSFAFKNDGKNDLIIHKTKASCGCTASTPEKLILKQGESSKIDIKFNSAGKKGEQHKSVTVISNDPSKPSLILNIKGTVTPKTETTPK